MDKVHSKIFWEKEAMATLKLWVATIVTLKLLKLWVSDNVVEMISNKACQIVLLKLWALKLWASETCRRNGRWFSKISRSKRERVNCALAAWCIRVNSVIRVIIYVAWVNSAIRVRMCVAWVNSACGVQMHLCMHTCVCVVMHEYMRVCL
jgi:hypothetical protein